MPTLLQPSANRPSRLFVLVNLAVLAVVATHHADAAVLSQPPAAFTVQPEEGGRLVYVSIAPATENDPVRNLFGLSLTITNTSTNEIRLTSIRTIFTYADNAVFARQFTRDVPVAGEWRATEYLTPDEAISLSDPPPVSVRIEAYFKGYTLPRTVQRNLARYRAPTADHKYNFPGSASDLGPNQYWSHIDRHTGYDQFFGYDMHVYSWDANRGTFSSHKPGTDGSNNDDSVGWGVPVHAMADGVVMHASTGFANNPGPGLRVIQRMAEASGGPVGDVAVTRLDDTHAASVVRLPAGNFQIQAWEVEDRGRRITPKGSIEGETVEEIAANELSSSRLVTAVRTPAGQLRVNAWQVTTNGIVSRLGTNQISGIKQLSLSRMSDKRFATAIRQLDDTLRLIVWEVSKDGMTISRLCETTAGPATSISTVALSSTRLATSLRTAGGNLKIILWDLLEDPTIALDRLGDITGSDQILKAVVVKSSATNLIAAVQTDSNQLKVQHWVVVDDGQKLILAAEGGGDTIQDLAIAATFDDSSAITGVVTALGDYRNILWKSKDGSLIRWGESDAGAIDRVALDALDTGVLLSAVRTSGGNLKLITWWVGSGGGNCVVILHGNCRVLYAHFKEGTLDPAVASPGAHVSAGQLLGRMGNSGSSEGPHLHIHSVRVPDGLTVEQILELEAQGTLEYVGFRPIPFDCARARRLDAIQWGDDPATFDSLQGHAVYFDKYGIRPTWYRALYVDGQSTCLSPHGEKEPELIGPLCFGGPFHTVNQGLNAACSLNNLFIRAGVYSETVLFNRRMTVRSYDGTAVIGH